MRIDSLLSPKCELRPSLLDGCGVFAIEPFAPGEIVAVIGGKIYTTEEIQRIGEAVPNLRRYKWGVAPGYHIGSAELFEIDDAKCLNHNCEANCGIKGQTIVAARRAIDRGEEMTIDYDTFELEPDPFECRCGSSACRGRVVTGTAWQDTLFVKRNRDFLSYFVHERIEGARPGGGAWCQ